MAGKRGRPSKSQECGDNRKKLTDATVELIEKRGVEAVTVRNVCEAAGLSIGTFYYHFQNKDDLLMFFLRETSFDFFELTTPVEDIAGRLTELYMHLVRRYMELGEGFMKSFYTTSNRALSAYMGEEDGRFASGTVMERSEREVTAAVEAGVLKADTEVHRLCMDVCTIVKGCVFEWCLNDARPDVEETIGRILTAYLSAYRRGE